MYLAISLFLLILLFFHLIIDRSRLGLLMAAVYISLFAVVISYILVWLKYGGIQPSIQYMLCFNGTIAEKLTYLPLSADVLSVLMSIGRSGFLFSFFSILLCFSDIGRSRERGLRASFLLIMLLNIMLFTPVSFSFLYRQDWFYFHQGAFFIVVRCVYVALIAVGIAILFRARKNLRIPLVKRQFSQVILLLASLSVIFIILILTGPMQVSYPNGIYYSSSRFFFSNNIVIWTLLLAVCMVVMLIGSRALWKYSELKTQLSGSGFSIDRRIRQSGLSVFMITHGLKNQLLVLLSMLDDLGSSGNIAAEDEKKVADMLSISQNMLDRINQLYTVFRNKTMALTEAEHPHLFVEEAVRKTGFPDRVSITCTDELPVLADREYLVEAFCCIIRNAIEAMQDGGILQIQLYAERGEMIFQFSDSGKGIDKKDLKRIFYPFYTSKNSKSNWGIGLSFVQQVVKSHYGHITVDSEVGRGTDFFIMLPVTRGKG